MGRERGLEEGRGGWEQSSGVTVDVVVGVDVWGTFLPVSVFFSSVLIPFLFIIIFILVSPR